MPATCSTTGSPGEDFVRARLRCGNANGDASAKVWSTDCYIRSIQHQLIIFFCALFQVLPSIWPLFGQQKRTHRGLLRDGDLLVLAITKAWRNRVVLVARLFIQRATHEVTCVRYKSFRLTRPRRDPKLALWRDRVAKEVSSSDRRDPRRSADGGATCSQENVIRRPERHHAPLFRLPDRRGM